MTIFAKDGVMNIMTNLIDMGTFQSPARKSPTTAVLAPTHTSNVPLPLSYQKKTTPQSRKYDYYHSLLQLFRF